MPANSSISNEPGTGTCPAEGSTLSQRVRFALGRAGLSQTELAARTGVTKGTVSNWVLGRSSTFKTTTLQKLATTLGVDPVWLATGKGAFDSAPPPEQSLETEQFKEVFSMISPDQREIVMEFLGAIRKYASGEDENIEPEEDEAPGTAVLTKAYEVLEQDGFREKFEAVPANVKASIVASMCARIAEEGDSADVAGSVKPVLDFYQRLPR